MIRLYYSLLVFLCLLFSTANVFALTVQANFSGYTESTNCIDCEEYFGSINNGDEFTGTLYYEFEEPPELVTGQSIYETSLLSVHYEINFEEISLSGGYYSIDTDGASYFRLQDENPSMTPEIADPSISVDEVVIDLYNDVLPSGSPFFPTSLDAFNYGTLGFWAFAPGGGWGFEFNGVIDNVQDVSPVPEPATALMIVLGISGIVCRKKFIQK